MEKLQIFSADNSRPAELPFADGGVRAGFPAPAQEYMESAIDLNRDLVNHPESTFYARVQGESMRDAGVGDGDILVVDKSLDLLEGDLAVCIVNGEFTVKFVERHEDHILLVPANPDFSPIYVGEGDSFEIWGIVTYVIRKMRGWGRRSR